MFGSWKGITIHAGAQSAYGGGESTIASVHFRAALCMCEGVEAYSRRKDHVLCKPPILGRFFR